MSSMSMNMNSNTGFEEKSMTNTNNPPSLRTQYHTQMSTLLTNFNWTEPVPKELRSKMLHLFTESKTKGLVPDATTYLYLMTVHKDEIKAIISIARHMGLHTYNIEESSSTSSQRKPKPKSKSKQLAKRKQIPLNATHFESLLNIYSRKRQLWDRVPEIFYCMKDHGLTQPPVSLLLKFLETFAQMRNEEYVMKTHSLLTVAHGGAGGTAIWDQDIYESVIDSWAILGRPKAVWRVFHEMKACGYMPRTPTYRSILTLYHDMKYWRAMIAIHTKQMENTQEWGEWTTKDFWHVICAYKEQSDLDALRYRVQKMARKVGDQKAFFMLFDAYKSLDATKELELAFEDLKKCDPGFRCPRSVMTGITGTYVQCGDWDRLKLFLFKEMFGDVNVRYYFGKAIKRLLETDAKDIVEDGDVVDEYFRNLINIAKAEESRARAKSKPSSRKSRRQQLDSFRPSTFMTETQLYDMITHSGPYEAVYRGMVDTVVKSGWSDESEKEEKMMKLKELLEQVLKMQRERVKEVLAYYGIVSPPSQ